MDEQADATPREMHLRLEKSRVSHLTVESSETRSTLTGVEAIFEDLVDQWRRETGHSSILQDIIFHPTYLRIIGLGEPALPLLLRELQQRPSHLLVALQSIARENPVRPGASLKQAIEDWLAWGRAKGKIA